MHPGGSDRCVRVSSPMIDRSISGYFFGGLVADLPDFPGVAGVVGAAGLSPGLPGVAGASPALPAPVAGVPAWNALFIRVIRSLVMSRSGLAYSIRRAAICCITCVS